MGAVCGRGKQMCLRRNFFSEGAGGDERLGGELGRDLDGAVAGAGSKCACAGTFVVRGQAEMRG